MKSLQAFVSAIHSVHVRAEAAVDRPMPLEIAAIGAIRETRPVRVHMRDGRHDPGSIQGLGTARLKRPGNRVTRLARKPLSLVNEHLHFFDLMALWEYVRAGDLNLLASYSELVAQVCGILAAAVLIFVLLRYLERRMPLGWAWRGSRRFSVLFLAAAACNAAIFFGGNLFWSISNQFIYNRTKTYSPFAYSYLLSAGLDAARIAEELHGASGKRLNGESTGQLCIDCPDIITVHVESVFDPKILTAYKDDPSLVDFLNLRLQSVNGPLKTHVAGGMSMISEFLFNCGIDNYAFGTAGSYPNLFVPKLVRRCTPGYLRDGGYKTQLVSSVKGNQMRYGEVYKAYGVESIIEPGSMGIPLEWFKMRDKFFVDAAIELLQKPRTSPRLTMLLTVWNHGPHGKVTFTDHSEVFPGPYDLSKAGTEELRDYINRLNDSITAFRRLEDFIERSPVPTIIVYYGDHHPAFAREFSDSAQGRFGNDIRYVTFYRIVRNFQSRLSGTRTAEYISLNQLFGEALEYGGVALPPELRARDAVLSRCGKEVPQCDDEQRRELRSVILN